jgi:hypothetical protein
MKDWVLITLPFTVLHRRPICEAPQAGFLTLPSLQQPSRPKLVKRQWLMICWRNSLFQKGGDYSGVAVPDFHRVPF